jgi:hypothetical protein
MSMLKLLSLTTLMVCSVYADPIVQYQVNTVGNTGTYTYFLSGFDYRANQPCLNNPALLCDDELDIQFPVTSPVIFEQLSNGVAGPGFDLLLFQPNNPPQAQGDYSALATVDHPPLAGPFKVDFTFTGSGTPGSQEFSISQFDVNTGSFQNAIVASGFTTALVSSTVPEPASWLYCGAGLIIAGVWLGFRRARKTEIA